VAAESTPPEMPITTFPKPRRVSSSRRKPVSHSSVISASMASGGGPPWSRISCRITGNDSGMARTIELARCSASVGMANSPV